MGFNQSQCVLALETAGTGGVERAVEILLGGQDVQNPNSRDPVQLQSPSLNLSRISNISSLVLPISQYSFAANVTAGNANANVGNSACSAIACVSATRLLLLLKRVQFQSRSRIIGEQSLNTLTLQAWGDYIKALTYCAQDFSPQPLPTPPIPNSEDMPPRASTSAPTFNVEAAINTSDCLIESVRKGVSYADEVRRQRTHRNGSECEHLEVGEAWEVVCIRESEQLHQQLNSDLSRVPLSSDIRINIPPFTSFPVVQGILSTENIMSILHEMSSLTQGNTFSTSSGNSGQQQPVAMILCKPPETICIVCCPVQHVQQQSEYGSLAWLVFDSHPRPGRDGSSLTIFPENSLSEISGWLLQLLPPLDISALFEGEDGNGQELMLQLTYNSFEYKLVTLNQDYEF